MRIITGSARGKRLLTLEGDRVRPTTDRVKEALFNILQFRIEGRRFLDLFAGSGQIGLEALSRGARSAMFVDSSRDSIQVLEENIKSTELSSNAKIYSGKYQNYLSTTTDKFDVAYIDPPYNEGMLNDALIKTLPCITKGGIIICEHTKEEIPPDEIESAETGVFKRKEYKYGKIFLSAFENRDVQ